MTALFSIRLADGRSILWAEYGDPHGAPTICLHGTPGSHAKFASADRLARDRGLRLICPDRWGYGGSSLPEAGVRTLGTYAHDVDAVLQHLGQSTCHIIGISGGGPFAVAVAAGLGGARVVSLGLVSPVGEIAPAPFAQGNERHRASGTTAVTPAASRLRLSAFHVFCFRILPHVPGGVAAVFHLFRLGLTVAPVVTLAAILAKAPPADRKTLRSKTVRTDIVAMFRRGLAPGVGGPVADMQMFANTWDVRLEGVTMPTRIWIGTKDRNVPLTAAVQLAQTLPQADLIRLDGFGHYWIVTHVGDVLDWIASQAVKQSEHDGTIEGGAGVKGGSG